jgi:hypothetical protein
MDRAGMPLRSLLLAVILLCRCQPIPPESPPQPRSPKAEARPAIVRETELRAYLSDERLLRMLKADEVVIIETDTDRVVVGDKVCRKRLGEVYYTVQDGWHLKRPNERMERKSGEGWLIWEQ